MFKFFLILVLASLAVRLYSWLKRRRGAEQFGYGHPSQSPAGQRSAATRACPRCKTPAYDEAYFCRQCGQALPPALPVG